MAAGGHRGGLVLSVSLSSKQRASKPASSNFPKENALSFYQRLAKNAKRI
jgi:hypothetical protein